MFKVKPIDTQVALDKASMDQTNPAAKPEPDKTNVQLPDEKKSFDALLAGSAGDDGHARRHARCFAGQAKSRPRAGDVDVKRD